MDFDSIIRRTARGMVMQKMVFKAQYSLDNEVWVDERPDVRICNVKHEQYFLIGTEKHIDFSEAVDAQVKTLMFPLIYEICLGLNREIRNQSRRLKRVSQYHEVRVV